MSVRDEPNRGGRFLTRFVVTIARRGHLKKMNFRGHRVQQATIGVATVHRGWVIVDVIVVGRQRRGAGSTSADKPGGQHEAGHATTASIVPHRLPVRLIPDPEDVKRFSNELAYRQEVRTTANLPPLDRDAEIEQFVRIRIAAEYRERLGPHVAAILAATPASGGMYATMVRHHNALREAQMRLFDAEGLLPPDGPFGLIDRT